MFFTVAVCSHAVKVLSAIPLVHWSPFMKRYIVCKLILFAALGSAGLSAVAGVAETTNAHPTTLDALVADALAKNPELRFYEAEIAAAKAGRKTAGLLANPELNGSVGQKSVRGAGLSAEGVAWSVSVMQPFEWPGRIGLRKAIANRDIELAELGYERFKTRAGWPSAGAGFRLVRRAGKGGGGAKWPTAFRRCAKCWCNATRRD